MKREQFLQRIEDDHIDQIDKFSRTFESVTFWGVGLATYGDYDNSGPVQRANFKEIIEYKLEGEFDRCRWIGEWYAGHGTASAGFYLDQLPATSVFYEPFIRMLEILRDYPSLNDEVVSEVETEMENEAWTDWVEDDYRKELEKRGYEVLDETDLRSLFRASMELANEYPIFEAGGGVYYNLDKIAEQTNAAQAAMWRQAQTDAGQMEMTYLQQMASELPLIEGD